MPPRTKPHTVATNSMRFFYTYNYLFFFLRKCSIVASESVVLKSHSSQKITKTDRIISSETASSPSTAACFRSTFKNINSLPYKNQVVVASNNFFRSNPYHYLLKNSGYYA